MSHNPSALRPAEVSLAHPRRRRGRRGLFPLVALLPFAVFTLIFAIYPLAEVVRMSVSHLQVKSTGLIYDWVGFDNFVEAFASPRNLQAIGNTVVFVVAVVLTTLLIGTALALIVDRAVWTLPLARNVLVWPAVIAPVVVSLTWLLILSPTAGGLNKVLFALGTPGQNWLDSGFGAMVAVIVTDTWHWTPVVFLFVYAALQGIDASVKEAGRIDGAGEWQLLRHVILPMLRPALVAVAVIRVIMSVKAFDEMYLLTKGGPDGATTLVSQRIKELFFDSMEYGQASAYSLVIVVATALIIGVVMLLRSRKAAS